MKFLIGLGSNLGDRKENLEWAARKLQGSARILRASPLVETEALVLEDAPDDWRKPFLNSVLEVEFHGTPLETLNLLKNLERTRGRATSSRWAPRVLDLDLLACGEQFADHVGEAPLLEIPHPELWNRQFVLAPLKHLHPLLKLPGHRSNVLARTRELAKPIPLWMGIFNLTPDSFSDGGSLSTESDFEEKVRMFEKENVNVFDLGAESTRPGARPIGSQEEWTRLRPALEWLELRFRSQFFRPLISVDTYHPETARKAIELGADMINDVSGLASAEMLNLLKHSTCDYVLMHNLGVPADPNVVLKSSDPVREVKEWARIKIRQIGDAGVDLERVLFDPGIGFGKSHAQSWKLLRGIDQFFDLPVRLLVGHSRKSFLAPPANRTSSDRDGETLGVSLRLAARGVDVIRVHEPHLQSRSYFKYQESQP